MSNYLDVIYNKEERPLNSYPSKLIDYLIKNYDLKIGAKLLEPGVGRGEFLNEFKKRGFDCYGCDLSHQAGIEAEEIEIKTGINFNKDKLPYTDNYFDIIYTKSLMEHLENPEYFLYELKRILKPGGKILSLVPDWESNFKIYFDDHTHKTPFTLESLKNIFKICGYTKVNVVKFRQLPIVWKYPIINFISSILAPFIPVRTKNKFLRWSRELMLIGYGRK